MVFLLLSCWPWALATPTTDSDTGAELDVLLSLLSWDRFRFLVVENCFQNIIKTMLGDQVKS
jgi:hypothetical protein